MLLFIILLYTLKITAVQYIESSANGHFQIRSLYCSDIISPQFTIGINTEHRNIDPNPSYLLMLQKNYSCFTSKHVFMEVCKASRLPERDVNKTSFSIQISCVCVSVCLLQKESWLFILCIRQVHSSERSTSDPACFSLPRRVLILWEMNST